MLLDQNSRGPITALQLTGNGKSNSAASNHSMRKVCSSIY
jgi:hypothetical protein